MKPLTKILISFLLLATTAFAFKAFESMKQMKSVVSLAHGK